MGNFSKVSINVNGKIHYINMEKGTTFENKGGIYKINGNGKLIKYNKNENVWTSANHIEMKNYQWQTFKNVANNDKDANTFSISDIELAQKMSDELLKLDLNCEMGKIGYKINNPTKTDDGINVKVSNGRASQSATLIFGIIDKFRKTKRNEETKPNNKVENDEVKPSNETKKKSKGLTAAQVIEFNITPKGSADPKVLALAPDPTLTIKNKKVKARIMVDISTNVLYFYDKNGKAQKAYRIASGKKSTPTHTGVRVISHVESWPYKNAPKTTVRSKNPDAFGPKALILQAVNPKNGQKSSTGEFIHGNNDKKSLGKYKSGGCMRMDNDVIKEIAELVNSKEYVVVYESEKNA